MIENLHILIDNRPAPNQPDSLPFLTEHGLSIWFEKGGEQWLIDTGASDAFIRNALMAGINTSQADYLVLSHNHNDHTGGVEWFLEINKKAQVYLSEWILKSTCYSLKEGIPKNIGMDKELLSQYADRFIRYPQKNTFITEGVALLSDIPSVHPLPAGNRTLAWQLYDHQENEILPDPFHHEIAVLVLSDGGNTLISSCTHKGILNTLKAAVSFSGRPVARFIGGLHLKDKAETKEELIHLAGIIEREYPELQIYTGHCTSDSAYEILKQIIPKQIHLFHSGYKFGQFCQQIM
ncbi:MAG: MBL fold metallo-hydrolase [Bacteroidales bacterium]|nr:MBL fold metallo-hydrolase [Bacteroidales bacterium]